MDEASIEQRAPGELKAQLKRIDAIKDLKTLAAELAREHAGEHLRRCSTSVRSRISRTRRWSSPGSIRAASVFPIATTT